MHGTGVVNHAGKILIAVEFLPLIPGGELIRNACGRQLLIEQGAVRGIAGIQALPRRGGGRHRQHVRVVRHHRVDDRPDLLLRAHADVHVDAPDDHLPTPVLGALDDLPVASLVAHLLVAPVGERVGTRRKQLHADAIGAVQQLQQLLAQVLHGGGDAIVNGGDHLHGVGHELAGHTVARVDLIHEVKQFTGAWHQVQGLRVDEGDLPLESNGGFRSGKVHRPNHPFARYSTAVIVGGAAWRGYRVKPGRGTPARSISLSLQIA